MGGYYCDTKDTKEEQCDSNQYECCDMPGMQTEKSGKYTCIQRIVP